MNRLQVCPLEKKGESSSMNWIKTWTEKNSGGCTNFPTFRNNNVLIVDLSDSDGSGELVFMLGTNDIRSNLALGESMTYGRAIGITIVGLTSSQPAKAEDFLALTPDKYKVLFKTPLFANKRETVLRLPVSQLKRATPKGPFGVVFSTFDGETGGEEIPYWCGMRGDLKGVSAKWRDDEVKFGEATWSGKAKAGAEQVYLNVTAEWGGKEDKVKVRAKSRERIAKRLAWKARLFLSHRYLRLVSLFSGDGLLEER